MPVVVPLVLAPVLVLFGGLAFRDGTRGADEADPSTPAVVRLDEPASGGAGVGVGAGAGIEALQARLRRLPGDAGSWSALGFAYLAQARSTGDAAFYPKAEEVFARSLEESPDNADALAGQAALANARHEFATGHALARRAVDANPYSASAKGVLTDSLLEIGRYEEAFATLQAMVDLKPGVPSYTRVAHARDLQGDRQGAQDALEQALAASSAVGDASYALVNLGELAFNAGDLDQAAAHFAEGLRRDPSQVPALAGRARVAAARGDVDAAVRDYRDVVARLPLPIYLVEYGELLDSVGRADEAREQYAVADATARLGDAAGVVPDVETVLYDADHGRPEQALATAEALYETRRSVQVEDALAWALHASGRSEEALQHAEAAQRLGTRNALWDYHRGMIQLELGRVDEARASLTRALETNPGFSRLHAPRARDALGGLS